MSDQEYLRRVREWLSEELGGAPAEVAGIELDLSALIPLQRTGEHQYG
ncbi:hypothetical protein [Amycolatopsis sp. 195334CR]|nr:hypothetical protein [Amycolatopsis sp. 195334CR]MBN6036465.1 hypothetical protein [Amycolatopsis sp. 195334CR]